MPGLMHAPATSSATMKISVRYFARVREKLGPGQELQFDAVNSPASVGALREWLCAQSPLYAEALAPSQGLRAALDQAMCSPDDPLHDGAEVAFFPPVTGG
jgi:molybdopterin synthase sulfur carrier subunit